MVQPGSAATAKSERVRQSLVADIRGREPHALLPTERELAATHNVSRATIRNALNALSDAGLVYRVQGAGTFVAGATISKTLSLSSFSEDMRARGWEPSSQLLAAEEVPAGQEVADDLGLRPEQTVLRISRVRLADGRPICLETAHFPTELVPGLLDHDLSSSLYEILVGGYNLRMVRAEQMVRAVVLDVGEAALLSTPSGAPALRVHRIGLDERDRPLESTVSIYRGDSYDLRFAVRR